MQTQAWNTLIKRIPTRLQNIISFVTFGGGEIMAQDILRLDDDFVVLRGRMAGSQDAGRIIVLPYDQIVNLALNRPMTEGEVQAVFGGEAMAEVAMAPVSKAAAEKDSQALDDTTPEGEPDDQPERESTQVLATAARLNHNGSTPPTSAPPAAKPAPVSKTILLNRLRERLAQQANR